MELLKKRLAGNRMGIVGMFLAFFKSLIVDRVALAADNLALRPQLHVLRHSV